MQFMLNNHDLNLVNTEMDTAWTYLTMLLISQIMYFRMKSWEAKNQFEHLLKEAIVTSFEAVSENLLEVLARTTKTLN